MCKIILTKNLSVTFEIGFVYNIYVKNLCNGRWSEYCQTELGSNNIFCSEQARAPSLASENHWTFL